MNFKNLEKLSMLFVLMLLFTVSVSAFSNSTNRISYYDFEDLTDADGILDLETVGDPELGTEFGKIGKAYHYDKVGDYVVATNNISPEWYVNAGDDFSFATWFRSDDSNPEFRYLVGISGSNDYTYKYIRVYQTGVDGYLYIGIEGNNGVLSTYTIQQDISDQNYHHLAVVHSNNQSKLLIYLDGVEQTGGTLREVLSGNIIDSTSVFRLGTHLESGGYYWNGDIDEFYFYNRTLSASEISTYVSDTNTNYPTTNNTETINSDMKIYWELDDLNDSVSGVNLNGTATLTSDNCVVGDCYEFDGSSHSLYASANQSVDVYIDTNYDYSFGGWFRSDDTNPETRMILFGLTGSTTGDNNFGAYQLVTSGYLRLQSRGTDAQYDVQVTIPVDISDQLWHHFVYVNDHTNGETRVYLDGELVDDTHDDVDGPGYIVGSTTTFRVGNTHDGTYVWNGALDELFLSHKALNDSEVVGIWASKTPYPFDTDLTSIQFAVDEDDGLDYTVQAQTYSGIANGTTFPLGPYQADSCVDSYTLTEYYLSGYTVNSTNVSCLTEGYDACVDGACVYNDYRLNDRDLVSYYDFEDKLDFTGVMNLTEVGTGLLNGTQYGKIGKGYRFDRVNAYLNSTIVEDWHIEADNEFSFSIWFRSEDSNPEQRHIFDVSSSEISSNKFIRVFQSPTTGYLRVLIEANEGDSIDFSVPVDITDHNYHHLAVVNDDDSNRLHVYFDGVEYTTTQTSVPGTGRIIDSTSSLKFGLHYAENYPWNGDIDEFYFYQRVLNESEIVDYFEAVNTDYPTTVNETVNSDMKIYWTLDDLNDSVSGIDLTAVGGITPTSDNCVVGDCYDFNAVDQYIYGLANQSIDVYTDADYDFSFGGWFRSDEKNPDVRYIIFGSGSNLGAYKKFYVGQLEATGYLRIEVESTSGVLTTITHEEDISDQLWHHFIFVNDAKNDETRLYIDGVMVDDTQNAIVGSSSIIDSTSDYYIGSDHVGNYIWDGALDEMFFSHKAFNDSEAVGIWASKTPYPFSENLTSIQFAVDEDDGLDYSIQAQTYSGIANGTSFPLGPYQSDYCVDSYTLKEFYLSGYTVNSTDVDCLTEGYDACIDGACVYNDYRLNDKDLVAYWDFEDLQDDIGGVNLTEVGSGLSNGTQYGKIESGYHFGGADANLYSVLQRDWYIQANNDFSFATWFRSNDTSPVYRHIFDVSSSDGTGNKFIRVFQSTTTGYIRVIIEANEGDRIDFSVPVDVTDQNYHHLAIVNDDGENRWHVYLDGVEYTTTHTSVPGTGNIFDSTSSIRIGSNVNQQYIWNGDIDEFYFYQRVLNESEISNYVDAVNMDYPTHETDYAYDTDSGQNYTIQGTTYNGTYFVESGYINDTVETDSCTDNNLTEYYLVGNSVQSELVNCVSEGYDTCSNGICSDYVTYAIDSDYGLNYSVLGTTYNGTELPGGDVNDTVLTDVCVDSDNLTEYYLVGDLISSVNVSCTTEGFSGGCSGGVCTVLNTAPYVDDIRLLPSTFIGEDDDVIGYCTGDDVDSDLLKYNFKWYVNNIVVKSGSTALNNYSSGVEVEVDTISNANYVEGDYLTFSCAPEDDEDPGDYVNSSTYYIYSETDYAPVMESVRIDPSGNHNTSVDFEIYLNASDVDSDTVKYEWRFVKNGAYQSVSITDFENQSLEVLAGALDNSETIVGDVFYVRARAYDGTSYSSWTVSNGLIIENTIPTMTLANITTTPLESSNLNASCLATDIDSEQSLTYEKTWDNGVTTYVGETLSYALTQDGEEWNVTCKAYDGVGYSENLTSSSVTIIGTQNLPVFQNSTIEAYANAQQIKATCLVSDADGNSLDYSYKLYENAISIESGTLAGQGINETEYLFDVSLDVGDEFIFSCEATDNQEGSSGWFNTTTLTVPNIQFTSETLNVAGTSIDINWSTDADSTQIYLDDSFVINTNLSSWTFEDLTPETEYSIALRPIKDSFYGNFDIFNETTLATDNIAPNMTNTNITPSEIYTNSSILGSCLATDVDNSEIFYTYAWKVNNISVGSGVTSQYSQNTSVSIGSLDTSKFNYSDNVSLTCIAFDGISQSEELTTETTVLNSEPYTENEFIELGYQTVYYNCTYDFVDVDGDSEINATYEWYKNHALVGTNSTYAVNSTSPGDSLVCVIETGDEYHNITSNTTEFVVGDFEKPVISEISVPSTSETDTSVLISAKCSDNVGVANLYPKIRFINPNYVEEQYQLYYEGDDTYARYHTFSIVGTYSDFEVECMDGNSNVEISQYDGTLISSNPTVVPPGDDGVSGGSTGEFRNITSFDIVPNNLGLSIAPGQTRIVEFEVINNDIVDIDFTIAVLLGEDQEGYDWISFDGGIKAFNFEIEKESGLSTNSKFVRYYITVPEDAVEGQYNGIIEVNGLGQTDQYNVVIQVKEGLFTNLWSFLDIELFTIPFTKAEVTDETNTITSDTLERGGKPFTVLMLLGTSLIVGIGAFGFFNIRKRWGR